MAAADQTLPAVVSYGSPGWKGVSCLLSRPPWGSASLLLEGGGGLASGTLGGAGTERLWDAAGPELLWVPSPQPALARAAVLLGPSPPWGGSPARREAQAAVQGWLAAAAVCRRCRPLWLSRPSHPRPPPPRAPLCTPTASPCLLQAARDRHTFGRRGSGSPPTPGVWLG